MHKVFSIFMCLVLSGCAAGLRVDQLAPIDTSSNEVVILNNTQWNTKMRRALSKEGFHVKHFSALKEIELSNNQRKETFNLADARYGLTLTPGSTVDRCLGGGAVKFGDFSVEVTDLKTNEMVLVVEQGGWTDFCFPMEGTLFKDLAAAIKTNWEN
ncbi:hypothetical protein [Halodesulfovibrio sp.]|jgi:DNA-dependent RNA polymerase auxiliary subunit epsilon|uniref:hypothetical protein n=1 Tax=Halodesulfovibrio sp. TaxID=1912772 RepID=UPI0025E1834C|nr:hypothetical protein [Halodesulfovibrio sp.]MCT4627953.1 hypothetical protein [Halodesulfovibrio sp.]